MKLEDEQVTVSAIAISAHQLRRAKKAGSVLLLSSRCKDAVDVDPNDPKKVKRLERHCFSVDRDVLQRLFAAMQFNVVIPQNADGSGPKEDFSHHVSELDIRVDVLPAKVAK